jgi:hypothetical protein
MLNSFDSEPSSPVLIHDNSIDIIHTASAHKHVSNRGEFVAIHQWAHAANKVSPAAASFSMTVSRV